MQASGTAILAFFLVAPSSFSDELVPMRPWMSNCPFYTSWIVVCLFFFNDIAMLYVEILFDNDEYALYIYCNIYCISTVYSSTVIFTVYSVASCNPEFVLANSSSFIMSG